MQYYAIQSCNSWRIIITLPWTIVPADLKFQLDSKVSLASSCGTCVSKLSVCSVIKCSLHNVVFSENSSSIGTLRSTKDKTIPRVFGMSPVWVAWSKGLGKCDLLLAGWQAGQELWRQLPPPPQQDLQTSTSCQSSWPDGRRAWATMNNTLFSRGQKAERLQYFSITRDIFRDKASIPKTPETLGSNQNEQPFNNRQVFQYIFTLS